MGDICSKTRKGKPSLLCRKQIILRTEGMGHQKSGHAEKKTEAVKEQARGSVNNDALLWAAARASVQLTWFLSTLLSGSSIGDKASSLASLCIYSSICCMRSYFGGGISPQAFVSVYSPGIISTVCKNRLRAIHI